jgi:hypothetical protein
VLDLVHALANADGGSEVKDDVDAAQCPMEIVSVAHVTDDQLDIILEIGGSLPRRTVDLRIEIVEGAHAVSGLQQFVGQVRRDESGTSRDQDLLRHSLTSRRTQRSNRIRRDAADAYDVKQGRGAGVSERSRWVRDAVQTPFLTSPAATYFRFILMYHI